MSKDPPSGTGPVKIPKEFWASLTMEEFENIMFAPEPPPFPKVGDVLETRELSGLRGRHDWICRLTVMEVKPAEDAVVLEWKLEKRDE